jgi:hypothetical protein
MSERVLVSREDEKERAMKTRHVCSVLRIAAACGLVCVWVTAVHATPVSEGGTLGLRNGIPVYSAPMGSTPGLWDIDSTLNSGSVKKDAGQTGFQFMFLGADGVSIAWTGNNLSQDLSTYAGGTSYLAEGTFDGGGTLTVTGKVRNYANPTQVLYDGLLLTANVQSFHLRETDKDSDVLHSIDGLIRVQITGGWLNTNSTMQLSGLYDMALVTAKTGPMDGVSPLNNFQADLVSRQAFSLQYSRVPEPSVCVLLLMGAGLFSMRRHFSRA